MKAIAPLLCGPSPLPALPAALTAPLKLAADFAKASKEPPMQAAYRSDFRIFEDWCAARGLPALPATAAALCGFLADEVAAGKRASTLGRRLAAIRYFHRAAGYDTPTGDEKVKAVLSGIRHTIGAAPVRKRAATSDMVIAMSATGTSLRALRDRAIILLGFAGAFRRSELGRSTPRISRRHPKASWSRSGAQRPTRKASVARWPFHAARLHAR